jgi:type I restriction enzyme M protein
MANTNVLSEKNGVLFDSNGKIIDLIDESILENTPEECVRQSFISRLINYYNYPKNVIRREVSIQSGSKEIADKKNKTTIRADIIVYLDRTACISRDQGKINFIVECKQKNVTEGYNQLVSYIFNTSAMGGVWTNGENTLFYQKDNQNGRLNEVTLLPHYGEAWGQDEIPKISELKRPRDIRKTLSLCHNKLYGRGMENADADLTMDMVRILLAKIQDEIYSNVYPSFWITNDQYSTEKGREGRETAAKKVRNLFKTYAGKYPEVFEKDETISVGDDTLVEAMSTIQENSFVALNDQADDWDVMGAAYEQFTHSKLKRQQGQFFTNRLVVKTIISMLDPQIGDRVLDPAGGSGGFATEAFRYLRRKVISKNQSKTQKEKQLDEIKNNVFLVEISKRLVKIAKTAMLLTGDGQSGMTKGNSLGNYSDLDNWIQSRCGRERPDIIVTNPPFSGQKQESMISDKQILINFCLGHSLHDNDFPQSNNLENNANILRKQAPELLFLERCIDWVKPGGLIGIILPKGILDNQTYVPYRRWILKQCKIDAVITLHKNTFQPDTGVRTCILFLRKLKGEEESPENYKIFMGQSQRVGKDSKGSPVYILDSQGKETKEIDEDLTMMSKRYTTMKTEETFQESELCFTIDKESLGEDLNLNPQHHSPRLNKTLKKIIDFENKEGWSVTTIGQLESHEVEIYIGPRWRSSNIVVENPKDATTPHPYLTANAAFEQYRTNVKWLDMAKASESQKKSMKALQVKHGDILISRSGTIGKVTYATKKLAEKYCISDDLIRVRVKDDNIRAFLLAYFMSSTAMDLMKLDEFGSVQQHLQPRHIQDLAIPIPDEWNSVSDIIEKGKRMISSMEEIAYLDDALQNSGIDSLLD